ncbi:hypothetical protein [Proteiniphilum sp.]|uniref:hypothetical protein n=1 Tax=Proteiniphilum sp. TaxID=1926877 RepID=UPI002B2147C3|nr:hypothetical protein [Proteiniphilum sp.]MEA4916804.1 hypothetical protein [Proteiniphilum sp.]
MMKLQRIYLLLVVLILAFTGCDKLIYDQYDQPEDGGDVESKVYLSVNIRSAQPNSGLRSINYDALNEDRVRDLAMVIFKSGAAPTGGEMVGVYTTSSLGSSDVATRAITAEIKPDKYDFYFVANMGLTEAWINANIANRAAMDIYLADAARSMSLNPALYEGASSSLAFPMARIYMNQEITSGGTMYQPKPFKPKQYLSEEYQVRVNETEGGGEIKDYVELIRVVAKLEVIIESASALNVSQVYFRNANGHFRLVEFDAPATVYFNEKGSNTPLRDISPSTAPKTSYIYYMPETFLPSTSTLLWNDNVLAENKPINYFTVVTNTLQQYDVPIISNLATITYTESYLSKAKGTFGGFTPNYNIYRNRRYEYKLRIIDQDIEIDYKVVEWNKVETQLYMGYGYNVEIDEAGKVTITNTVQACAPNKVVLRAVNGAHFGTPSETVKSFGYDTDPGHTGGDMAAGYSAAMGTLTLPTSMVSDAEYLEVYYITYVESAPGVPDAAKSNKVHTFKKP